MSRLYALTVNYSAATSHDINLRYMFTKADLPQAAKDHDYFTMPYPYYWILNRIKVIRACHWTKEFIMERDSPQRRITYFSGSDRNTMILCLIGHF